MSFAILKRCTFIGGLVFLSQALNAALQTTPYIAIHSQPKYAALSVMPYANIHAPKGGYLSQASNGTFDNLNSMNGKGSSTEGIDHLFDSLMANSLDEPGVMYPLLAEKVTFDPDKTRYVIFHLNPKARFSDGSAVTAQDVKFSFDAYQTKSNPGLQMYLADLDKTEVLSKYAVKMSFKSENNAEMPLILSSLPIYSAKDWQGKDFTRVTMQPILGSGPYLIDRIDAGRSITYKRNPNYWGKDLPVNKGRYNFERLKYVYYRNLDIAFEGFKSGQYTLHEEFTARKWVTEYDFPAVKAGMVVKYKFQHQNPIPTQSFVFNTRRAPFDDIQFRQAISNAYDFEWQNKALFYGQYQRLQSYFSNSELEAKGIPSQAEMAILKPHLARLSPIQRQGVLKKWQYPVSDASGFNRVHLLMARQQLLQAGYRVKNGQLLDTKGKPIRIEFLIHQDGLQRTLMPFIRNMKRLGVQVSIRHVDVPQYIERMRSKDFDMTTSVMPQSLNPGNEQAQFWGSASADQPGNYNYSGIKNPVIDTLIEQIIQAPNREQLVLRTQVLDRLLRAGYYQIPTYGKGENWFAYWNMYHQPKVKPKLSAGIDYWWSDAAQAKKVNQYLRKQ
ncbi:extracellular solute-binding protein [Acinetobacter albensis]|uniref:Microcin C transport system substrate-binding protein n=1 Tax=Acinetobacter albensis TaxID=1673609 RepID=A0A1C4GS48_9GAMM|nr:extracellular solute-binding protein [Acinetobacter albensis]SCC70992.1 microcin C transport system substrate-binding protein [Acinetobacter albensis]